MKQRYGACHLNVGRVIQSFAHTYVGQKKYDQAIKSWIDLLTVEIQVYGEHHQEVSNSKYHLAYTYMKLGKHPEAEALLRQSLESDEINRIENFQTAEKLIALTNVSKLSDDEREKICLRALLILKNCKTNELAEQELERVPKYSKMLKETLVSIYRS